jgi:glutathione-specific gamma-glutamylcyclotransferase
MMDLWVFAYGSLMWRPNFHYEEKSHAVLEGAHRALCVYSAIHRGVPWAPGLVLGLDKGGRCEGMALRVSARLVQDTRAYLHRRENVTNTYNAAMKPVKLMDGSHRTMPALCFVANRRHPQYAGDLPLGRQAFLVRRSMGASGANIDYVVNTVEHLRALGIHDGRLEQLMAILGHGLGKAKSRGPRAFSREYEPAEPK